MKNSNRRPFLLGNTERLPRTPTDVDANDSSGSEDATPKITRLLAGPQNHEESAGTQKRGNTNRKRRVSLFWAHGRRLNAYPDCSL